MQKTKKKKWSKSLATFSTKNDPKNKNTQKANKKCSIGYRVKTKELEAPRNKSMIKKLHEKADRLLIDAPCSGLGVLRRNPDSKWKLKPEFIQNIMDVQRDILQDYSKILKPGGKMVYATCSILPSENEKQIEFFLNSDAGENFKLVKQNKVLAHKSGYDGFYMALLEKKA